MKLCAADKGVLIRSELGVLGQNRGLTARVKGAVASEVMKVLYVERASSLEVAFVILAG
jgi:hypothetical protein